MKKIQLAALGVLLSWAVAGPAAGAQSSLPPPGDPLGGAAKADSGLVLRGEVTFVGRRLRICNRVRNVGAQTVVTGRSYPLDGAFSTHFLGRDGTLLVDHLRDWPAHHPMLVPPPPPRDDDDETPYEILAPGAQTDDDCGEFDLPRGVDSFTVISLYHNWRPTAGVPRRLRETYRLFMQEKGELRSNDCAVDVRRHRVECAPSRP
jgi:hypothetical protein